MANLWLNGELAGEYTLNAALASHYNVPILMCTGDQTACAQMVEQLGPLEVVMVKQAVGRFSAECLPPTVTQEMIEQGAKRAVTRLVKKDVPQPLVFKAPIKVTVELFTSDMADRAMLLPGVERDGLKLSFAAGDVLKAYSGFRALVSLSNPH